MSRLRASLVMDLVDRVTGPARRIQERLSGLTRRSGLDRLTTSARQLGTATRHSWRELTGLTRRVTLLSGVAAGAAWSMHRLVSGFTGPADAAYKLSGRISMTHEEIQLLMGAAGRMTELGESSMSANLERFSRRMARGAAGMGEAAKAYNWAGIDLRDGEGNMRSAMDVMMDVADVMSNIESEEVQQRFSAALFGNSGAEMINMLREGGAAIQQEMDAWLRTGQLVDEDDAREAAHYNTAVGELTGTIRGLRNSVVIGLLPGLNDWLDRLNSLTQANREMIAVEVGAFLTELWGGLTRLGRAVGWAADRVGGFGSLLAILAGIMAGRFIFSTIQTGIALYNMGRAFVLFAGPGLMPAIHGVAWLARGLIGLAARAIPMVITGLRILSVALLTTPIGWIIGGLTLLAGAAYWVYRNWDWIGPWFGNLWQGIQDWFSQGIGGITRDLLAWSPAGLVMRAIDGIFEAFGARPLSTMVTEWFSGVPERVSQLWQGIQAWFSQGIGGIARDLLTWSPAGLVMRAIDGIFEAFGARPLSTMVTEWFSGVPERVGQLWQGIQDWFSQGIGGIASDLLAWSPAGLLMRGIDEVFELFGARPLTDLGRDWIGGLWEGIGERWGQLTSWLSQRMSDLTGWMPDWARDRLGLAELGGVAVGGSPEASLGAPMAQQGRQLMGPQSGRAEVDGELRIHIDSEGRPRVESMRSRGGLDFSVDSGLMGMNP